MDPLIQQSINSLLDLSRYRLGLICHHLVNQLENISKVPHTSTATTNTTTTSTKTTAATLCVAHRSIPNTRKGSTYTTILFNDSSKRKESKQTAVNNNNYIDNNNNNIDYNNNHTPIIHQFDNRGCLVDRPQWH